MGKFEDIVRQLRDEGLDHYADELEPFSATQLRQKAAKADELERELTKVRSELEEVKILPRKQEAFRQVGVDFDALRPAELEVIQRVKPESGDPTVEWAEKIVEQYRLPVGQAQEAPEQTGAYQVVQAARSAPAGLTTRPGTITPDTIASWDMSKRQEFREKYPDAWKALADGGEVTGIAFP